MTKLYKKDKRLTKVQWKLVSENVKLVNFSIKMFGKNYPKIYKDIDTYKESAMLALINSARKYNTEIGFQFSTYAVTSILRQLKNTYKKMENNPTKSFEDFGEDLSSINNISCKNGDILDDLILKERKDILQDIIKNSPQKVKDIIKMRFQDNLNYTEIGDNLSVSRETARIYCKEAIIYLSKKMREKNI